jgi:hypothetical protein
MPETFLTIAKILFGCSCFMIVITAMTMLIPKKRRSTLTDEEKLKLQLSATYGKHPEEYERIRKNYYDTDSMHVDKDI